MCDAGKCPSAPIFIKTKKLQWALYFGYSWFDTRKIKTAATHALVSEPLTRNKNTENTIHLGKYKQIHNLKKRGIIVKCSPVFPGIKRIQTKK